MPPVPEEEQQFKAVAVLTYKDEDGKEFKIEKPIMIKIKPKAPESMEGDMMMGGGGGGGAEQPAGAEITPEKDEKKGISKTVWIIIISGAVVLIIVAVVVVKKIRAKRSLEEDEDI
jgi:uncharacterized integral membrane protein